MFLYYFTCYQACYESGYPLAPTTTPGGFPPWIQLAPNWSSKPHFPCQEQESLTPWWVICISKVSFISERVGWTSGVCNWAVELARQSWSLCVLNTTLFHFVFFPLWRGKDCFICSAKKKKSGKLLITQAFSAIRNASTVWLWVWHLLLKLLLKHVISNKTIFVYFTRYSEG